MGELIYIGDDKYLMLYSDGISGNGIIVNVKSTTITTWLEYTFDNQKISNLDAVYLSNNKVFIVNYKKYKYKSNSNIAIIRAIK